MNYAIHSLDRNEEFISQLLEKQTIEELKKVAEKNTYECPYCQETLHVRGGTVYECHFYHLHNEACDPAKQVRKSYRQYQKQIKRESTKHSVLVSIVKDELRTAASGKENIEIVEGYRVAKFKKHFPDLYVCIGSREWAITILTELNESENNTYAKNFRERHHYFQENGLEPLWLFDKANFATEKIKRSLVMWEIEYLSSRESKEDFEWKESISQYAERYDLFRQLGYPMVDVGKELLVKSIYYIAQVEEKNAIRVYRYIEDSDAGPYRGFLVGETSTVPFSQALQIEWESFRLSDPENERKLRTELKEEFLKSQEEAKERVKRIEEEEATRKQLLAKEREIREETERKKKQEEAIEQDQRPEYLFNESNQNSYSYTGNSAYITSYGEQELDNHWRKINQEKRRKLPKKLTSILQVPEKKYKEFVERLLTIRIEGEIYIQSPNIVWRKIMIDWLEENYFEEEWTVSVQEMFDKLQKSNVEFSANSITLLKYPIRNFLSAYTKSIKELKVKNKLIIAD